MNQIRAIQALNKRELEHGIPPEASWHADYRDTAYIYFGGLPYELSEGDIIVVFSQYGEPVFIKLARDRETGRSKGFGWLKYRDQRSADLAVDNLGGATVVGRVLRVDHARYKPHEDDDPEEGMVDWESMMRMEGKEIEESETDEEGVERERGGGAKMLEEEKELARLLTEHDEDDPMKAYLVEEKKKEIAEARERREKKDRHRRHRSHRSRRYDSDDEERESRRERRERPARRREKSEETSPRPGRRRSSRRRSPGREEESGDDAGGEAQDRERRRRDRERRRGGEDDDGPERDRRRRRERDDDSRERRRGRDDRDRPRRERRRSRSP